MYIIVWTFPLTLKHNAMGCKILNTGKTPVQIQYGKLIYINTVQFALFLQIWLSATLFTVGIGH